MLAGDFLTEAAARFPQKPALISQDRRLTYAEIAEQAAALAHFMLEAGLRPGDRVVIRLGNSPEAVVAIFATLWAGGVFVPVHPQVRPQKLAYILDDCQAAGFVSTHCLSTTFSIKERRSLRWCIGLGLPSPFVPWERALALSAKIGPADRKPEDLACLIYTSGSTGAPKGVMSEHRNVVFAADSIIQYLGNQPSDVVINVMPLSFDYGLYQLLMTTRFGGTLVLEESFAFPPRVLALMARERVTGFPGVPTVFAEMLDLNMSAYDLSALRYMTNTAAALPVEHLRRLRALFPRVQFFSMYGLTETKRTLYLPPEQLSQRPGSVGIAIPGTRVWLEDAAGRVIEGAGTGQLVVEGGHVMRGYWGDPELTSRKFKTTPDGRRIFYSGDLFRRDAEGYLYFVARQDDVIKCGGQKVAPKEVEEVLYSLPGVREAAAVGMAHPLLGQVIKVFIAPPAPLTPREVIHHCRARLEPHMVPFQVEFRSQLPKNASGKIDRRLLREAEPPPAS